MPMNKKIVENAKKKKKWHKETHMGNQNIPECAGKTVFSSEGN